jgi:choice-of-anchor B domain-containing protein
MKKISLLLISLILTLSCSNDDATNIPQNVQPVPQNNNNPPPIQLATSAPCVDGSAGGFPCNGFNLVSRIELDTMGASRGNDCWGWTDPVSGIEYAIMGLDTGTAFIDLSNPAEPVFLGTLSSASGSSAWRDVKVYNDHAFIVSEAAGHGMQIFDLTKLRNVNSPPENFNADATYDEFGNAHNIVINEDSGFAYAVGTTTFNGGPHFIDINDPLNPLYAGGYEMDSYSHDAQVVIYNGPDTDHTGAEILIGSNENEVVIIDISDKFSPQQIASISYDQTGYTHQGWFTEDQRYFIVGDELDELNFGFNSRTLVFDFIDLDNPELATEYYGATSAIDHNGYVKGSKYYLANYTHGMSEIDLSGIGSGNLFESGFFDTHPANDASAFRGAWSVYPYFSSGNIIISDINLGFFVVKRGN